MPLLPTARHAGRGQGLLLVDRLQGAALMTGLGPVPRLGVTREEAAASLSMSLDSFERHVQPSLRMVRVGRMRIVPISEIQRWLDANAEATIAPRRAA